MIESLSPADAGSLNSILKAGEVVLPDPVASDLDPQSLANLSDDDLPIGTVKVVSDTGEIVHIDGRDSSDDPDLAQTQAIVDDMDFDGELSYPDPGNVEAVAHIQAVALKAQRMAEKSKAALLARMKAQQDALVKATSKMEATT